MGNNDVIAPLRARLLKLYITGEEVEFSDEEGDFTLWVQKTTPGQDKIAYQKSRALRGPIMAIKKNKLDPKRLEYLETLEQFDLTTREKQIEWLIGPKVAEAKISAMERIAAEDEWAKDDYLSSLQDAWNDGLEDEYNLDNTHEEGLRVYTALRKYTDQVLASLEFEKGELRSEWEPYYDDDIEEKVIDQLIESEADGIQLNELRTWQLFFAVRNPENHAEQFFESREQIDEIDRKVKQRLMDKLEEITVDSLEGKG